jgi:NADH:ubiquinone oxidoreductase subunit 6 (subunit J)
MIPITAIAGGIAIAIVAIIMGARKKELEHKERLLAMEKGIEIPQAQEPEKRPSYRSNRTAGLVMTLLGIAIMVANWAVAGTKGGVWGLIPLAIGVGLLISAALEKKEVAGK